MSRDADGSMYDGEWDSGERSGEGAWLAGEDYEPPAPQSGSMDHDEPHPPTVAPPSISLPDSPSSSSVYSSSTAEATPRRPPTDVAATAAPPSDYAIKYHGSWRGGKRAGHGTVFYRSGASYVPPTAPSGRCRHRKCGAPQASSRASVWRTHRLSPPPPTPRASPRRVAGTRAPSTTLSGFTGRGATFLRQAPSDNTRTLGSGPKGYATVRFLPRAPSAVILCRPVEPLHSVCAHRLSRVACRSSRVAHRVSRVACRLSRVACRLSRVACRLSRVACRLSRVACRLSLSRARRGRLEQATGSAVTPMAASTRASGPQTVARVPGRTPSMKALCGRAILSTTPWSGVARCDTLMGASTAAT